MVKELIEFMEKKITWEVIITITEIMALIVLMNLIAIIFFMAFFNIPLIMY